MTTLRDREPDSGLDEFGNPASAWPRTIEDDPLEPMGSVMRLVASEVAGAISTGGHWYPKPIADRILVILAAAREQAATEARRELLAKVGPAGMTAFRASRSYRDGDVTMNADAFDDLLEAVLRLIEEQP